MPWTDALIRFQEIDLELQHINERLADIAARLQDQSELDAARDKATQRSAAAKAAQKAQADLEFELQRVQIELQRTDHSLYSGTITNARELRDLQTKAQFLCKRQAKLEDDLLEAMLAREEKDEAAQEAQVQLTSTTQRWESTHQDLLAERSDLREQGEALIHEAQHLKEKIPPAVQDSYHYLKSRTGGIPVSRLVGETCSMCGVEVLSATLRKVKSGEEAFCDSCRRLLVV